MVRLKYTIYTMTLRRMSLMLETNRWRMAGWRKSHYVALMQAFDEMFAQGQDVVMHNEFTKIQMYNKIKNMLPILYMSLLLQPDDYSREVYKDLFGKYPDKGEDLTLILNEIKRMTKRYMMMFSKKQEQPVGDFSFEDVIVGVESVLEHPIDRDLVLYQFKTYYDLALKRIAQIDKNGRH
jgi:galactokinase/mevalonate kinase-like predicted kinase